MKIKLVLITIFLTASFVLIPMQGYALEPVQGMLPAFTPQVLDVQVVVPSESACEPTTGAPLVMFVRVTKNSVGVTGLPAANFAYSNSFPQGSNISYCGDACFVEGQDGVYLIVLIGDWDDTTYAGTLSVSKTSKFGNILLGYGSTLVSFGVPSQR